MNLEDFTLPELHGAISTGFAQIQLLWLQIRQILGGTEVFDAELSMEVTEAMETAVKKADALLRDSLYKQGYTDEMIADRVEYVKRMLGLE